MDAQPEARPGLRATALTYLRGFAILSAFAFLGGVVAQQLPFFFPGPLVGFLLLFAALVSGVIKRAWVQDASAFLAKQLGLFFLPAAVLATREGSLRGAEAARFVGACVAGQFVVFFVAGRIHRALFPKLSR